ncbi:hypothetical protein RN001_001130 [Aquatica leii]|uniref:RING-type E3 ubiquitin transferase n=1 Tax=Aquatica leii TaxID=1421715 RepID=A0AAN7PFQ7_9COLE|nr:hypothetical protein RN001_001130 [Aquatica leii]
MWCLISQPNSVIFEVRVDPKAIGQECLEKVCEHLGISNESDYFGLKYESNKGEELWLNLRNPIHRQVSCHGHTSPLRFALRVKFWVPPHLLLQETTRNLFYLHAKLDLIEKRLLVSQWSMVAKIIALIAQAESGDYNPLQPPHHLYMHLSSISSNESAEKPQDLLQMVIAEHEKCEGMKPTTAKYWLLKEVSTLDNFGEEVFSTKSNGGVLIGVGPNGITILNKGDEKQVIPFTAIQSASSHNRSFKLGYMNVDNVEAHLDVKLDSSQTANGLYRAITEKHAFYSCETVRSAVTAQFIRDLKGTIVSIFNEDSTLGKKYVFDIRRTCREVYDNARRALYQESKLFQNIVDGQKSDCYEGNQRRNSHERLTKIMDAMTCKICMDSPIDTAFLPCAHVVACSSCAARCERCPLCRADIAQPQKIYLPEEFSEPVC